MLKFNISKAGLGGDYRKILRGELFCLFCKWRTIKKKFVISEKVCIFAFVIDVFFHQLQRYEQLFKWVTDCPDFFQQSVAQIIKN